MPKHESATPQTPPEAGATELPQPVKSNYRLYYDSSKQVLLEAGSPRAAFLACIPGTILSGKLAEDYERFLKGKNEKPEVVEEKESASCGQERRLQGIAEGAMSNRAEGSKPFQEYPKMVYHMDGNDKIVQNREEHQALGPQWFKSPADAIAAPPALWFPTQLQAPINEAVSTADRGFQMAKSRIVKGGPITEIDLKSLTVKFVREVFPAIAGQARQLLKEGLWTNHRLLDEVDKCLRHLVRHATQRLTQRSLNDEEFHAWVLQEVKGTSEYTEALRLALNAEFAKSGTEEPVQPKPAGVADDGGTGNRKGYRAEVRQWMKRRNIETVELAAERLGVSIDVLKSVMSAKGNRKYGKDTLEQILKKIRYKKR